VHLLRQAFGVSTETRFAIISGSDTRQSILAALSAGFHGFISKQQPDGDILQAIRDIASGRIYVPPALAESEPPDASVERTPEALPATSPLIASSADLLDLTPRQREVLSHLALGRSNKEIAQALHIAEATTKVHAAALLRALGARNRTEAAFKAGKLIDALDRSPPPSPVVVTAPAVREDRRTLPLRLIDAKPAARTPTARLRRKPSSLG
jgi:DNA-binding NarL/FixJ family response regulator